MAKSSFWGKRKICRKQFGSSMQQANMSFQEELIHTRIFNCLSWERRRKTVFLKELEQQLMEALRHVLTLPSRKRVSCRWKPFKPGWYRQRTCLLYTSPSPRD